MSSYRLTRRADEDLIDIYLYTLENFGLAQAERYAEGMRACFNLLADNPRMGVKADHVRPGVRRHHHGGHTIFYREDGGEAILVLAVIHGRRRSEFGLDDLD